MAKEVKNHVLKRITIQSNEITLARNEANIYERRILNAIIQVVSNGIQNFANYKIEAIDYYRDKNDSGALKMFIQAKDLVGPDRYEEIRNALISLRQKTVLIETKRGERVTGFINWGELPTNSGIIELNLDVEFYRSLFNLAGGYTIFQGTVLNSLTSTYAMKLYEYLALWRDRDTKVETVSELRRLTNTTDKYAAFGEFKREVIERAKTHLDANTLTDIQFTYELIKEGRQVTKIKFNIIKTDQAHEINQERNRLSPHWDFSKGIIENAKMYGIALKGKNYDLFKQYKETFGENKLADDLKQFHGLSVENKKGTAYIIGCLKNTLIGATQTKLFPTLTKQRQTTNTGAADFEALLANLKEK